MTTSPIMTMRKHPMPRLRRNGFDDRALARLHAPNSLSIGARTPEQIALTIMAEVVAVLNGALSS